MKILWTWTNRYNGVWAAQHYGEMDTLHRIYNNFRARDVIEISKKDGNSSRAYITEITAPIPYGKSGKGVVVAFIRSLTCMADFKNGKPCTKWEHNNTGFCKRHQGFEASYKPFSCNGCGAYHLPVHLCPEARIQVSLTHGIEPYEGIAMTAGDGARALGEIWVK